MKKNRYWFVLAVLVFGTIILSSCGCDENDTEHNEQMDVHADSHKKEAYKCKELDEFGKVAGATVPELNEFNKVYVKS